MMRMNLNNRQESSSQPWQPWSRPDIAGRALKLQLSERTGGGLRFGGNASSIVRGGPPNRSRLRGLDGTFTSPPGIANRYGALSAGNLRQQAASADVGNFAALGYNSEFVNTPGFRTNPTVPGNNTVIKNANPDYGLPNQYDMAFFRRQKPQERQRLRQTAEGLVLDQTPREAFTLPTLNHFLAIKQTKRSAQDVLAAMISDERRPDPIEGIDFRRPCEIMDYFYPAGVVYTEQTDTGYNLNPRHYSAYTGPNRTAQHDVGLVVSGKEFAYTLFGTGNRAQTNYFLILKPMPRPEAYVVSSDRDGHKTLTFDAEQRATLHEEPFQFVPYATMEKVPPLETRTYIDELGDLKYAPYWHLASVCKEAPVSRPSTPSNLMRDVGYVHKQPVHEIILFR